MSASTTAKKKETNTAKAYDPTEIKVRRVNFQFSKKNPRFYYKNNPFSTHFINVLHIVFPTGERFFVNSVLKHQKEITDGKLNIKGFEEHIDKVLHKIVAKIEVEGTRINNIDLVATACLEHFTALFGHALFAHVETNPQAVPEDMAELFLWHAAEEIEHKNVAYDVYQKVDKHEHQKRIVMMPIVTALLYFYLSIGTIMLMYQDRKYIQLTKLPKHFYDFATGLFSDLHSDLVKEYFSFFKKDFHPSNLNDYHYAEEFFKDKAYA